MEGRWLDRGAELWWGNGKELEGSSRLGMERNKEQRVRPEIDEREQEYPIDPAEQFTRIEGWWVGREGKRCGPESLIAKG